MSTRTPDARRRVDGDLLRYPGHGLMVAVALLIAVAALTVSMIVDRSGGPVLGEVDGWWRGLIQPPPSWAESASQVLKTLGSGWVMVPLRIAVALWLLARRRRSDLAAWLLAWALADVITVALKPWVARLRPDGLDHHSFPSAHAKTAAQVAIGIVLVATSPWRSRALPWALAIAWIVAMAFSRTILDEHWLSDVVAGSLLGVGCTVGVAATVQFRRDRTQGGA